MLQHIIRHIRRRITRIDRKGPMTPILSSGHRRDDHIIFNTNTQYLHTPQPHIRQSIGPILPQRHIPLLRQVARGYHQRRQGGRVLCDAELELCSILIVADEVDSFLIEDLPIVRGKAGIGERKGAVVRAVAEEDV